jgi:phosphate acetyltransferase
MLLGRAPKVGYFRPIIDENKPEEDNHINTVLHHFDLKMTPQEAYAITRSQYVKKRNQGKEGAIFDTIIDKFKKLEETYDFILVEGTDFSGEGAAIELNTNISIAKNLAIPAILVSSGVNKTLDEFIGDVGIAHDLFKEKEVEVLSIMANKIQTENVDLVREKLTSDFGPATLVNVIPMNNTLKNPTIEEISNKIEGHYLFGKQQKNNQVSSYKVGAMQLRNHLVHLEENCMIITPGDRADIILGAIQANISTNYPKISGILLTGGLLPEEPILKLIEGSKTIPPILSTQKATYEVTTQISRIQSNIYKDNKQKILASIAAFEKYVSVEKLSEKLLTHQESGITPRMFQYQLLKKAAQKRKHIVLPEGNDPRILKAVAHLLNLDIIDITLLGKAEEIKTKAAEINVNIEKAHIIDPVHSTNFKAFADTFYELRKHKNVTHEVSYDIMSDVSYFGTMMVHKGLADGMVSGAVHTTQHTIRPALQFIKTKPGVSTVSSIFFMCLEDRVTIFGDCAINPNPNAQQLAEIAISSALSSQAFGIEPKVAMLSYSSGTSGKGADVDKVREATEIVKKECPNLKIEGPIQYDAAVNPSVGKAKLPNSTVAGQASVLIFPDLNTGNNTYKAVQQETHALAIGPMLQGLNKPVNDLSRGCTEDDVFNTILLTAIQAQEQ